MTTLVNLLRTEGLGPYAQWERMEKLAPPERFGDAVIDDALRDHLLEILEIIPLPFPGSTFHIDWIAHETFEDLVLNQRGKLIHAPYYLIFQGDRRAASLMNLGFLLQHFRIYAGARDLTTACQELQLDRTEESLSDFAVSENRTSDGEARPHAWIPLALAIGRKEDATPSTKRKKVNVRQVLWDSDPTIPADIIKILETGLMAELGRTKIPVRFLVRGRRIELWYKRLGGYADADSRIRLQIGVGAVLGSLCYAAELLNRRITFIFPDSEIDPDIGKYRLASTFMIEA